MGYRYTFELDYGGGRKKQYTKHCIHYRKTTLYARCKSLLYEHEIKGFRVFINTSIQVDEQFSDECERG
jgi:hypothetical protein